MAKGREGGGSGGRVSLGASELSSPESLESGLCWAGEDGCLLPASLCLLLDWHRDQWRRCGSPHEAGRQRGKLSCRGNRRGVCKSWGRAYTRLIPWMKPSTDEFTWVEELADRSGAGRALHPTLGGVQAAQGEGPGPGLTAVIQWFSQVQVCWLTALGLLVNSAPPSLSSWEAQQAASLVMWTLTELWSWGFRCISRVLDSEALATVSGRGTNWPQPAGVWLLVVGPFWSRAQLTSVSTRCECVQAALDWFKDFYKFLKMHWTFSLWE